MDFDTNSGGPETGIDQLGQASGSDLRCLFWQQSLLFLHRKVITMEHGLASLQCFRGWIISFKELVKRNKQKEEVI